MLNVEIKVYNKIIAIVLAIAVLLTMVPLGKYNPAFAEAENGYVLSFVDESGNAVSGVDFSYKIVKDDSSVKSESVTVTGSEHQLDLTEYKSDIEAAETSVKLVYTASKEADNLLTTGSVELKATSGSSSVVMKKTVKLTFLSLGGDGTLTVDGEEFTDEKSYEKGTQLQIKVTAPETYKIHELKIDGENKDSAVEKSEFEIGVSDEKLTLNTDTVIAAVFCDPDGNPDMTEFSFESVPIGGKLTASSVYSPDTFKTDFDSESKDFKLSVYKNDSVKITVLPDSGYRIGEFLVNSSKQELDENNSYILSKPENISVTFVKTELLTVKYNSDGGSVTVAKEDGSKLEGITEGGVTSYTLDNPTEVTITPTVSEGYRLAGIKVNGEDKSLTEGSLKITVNNTTEVVVELVKLATFTIKYNNEQGSVTIDIPDEAIDKGYDATSGSHTVTVDDGSEITLTVSANTAGENKFRIGSVTIGGKAQTLDTDGTVSYTVSGNTEAAVIFVPITGLSVNSNSEQGQVSVALADGGTVLKGTTEGAVTSYVLDIPSNVDISVKANEGYRIGTVSVNGEERQLTDGKLTLKVESAVEIEVTYVKLATFTVSYDNTQGNVEFSVSDGDYSLEGKYNAQDHTQTITVDDGTVVTVAVTPKNDGENARYRIGAVSVGEIVQTLDQNGSFTYEVTGSVNASVTFVPLTGLSLIYDSECGSVVVSAKDGTPFVGSVEGNTTSFTLDNPTDAVISVEANDGYRIGSVTVNGNPQELIKGSFDYTVSNSTTVNVIFVKLATLSVQYESTQGSITLTVPDGAYVEDKGYDPVSKTHSITVDDGTDVVIGVSANNTVSANARYRIGKVTANDSELTLDEHGPLTYKVTGDVIAKVEFVKLADINVTYDKARGTVELQSDNTALASSSSGQTYTSVYDDGAIVNILVDTNDGYRIGSVKIDGKDVYEFSGEPKYQYTADDGLLVTLTNNAVNVEITFVKIYNVEISQNADGGSIDVSGINSDDTIDEEISETEKTSVTVKAKEGYYIREITASVNGVQVFKEKAESDLVDRKDVKTEVTFDIADINGDVKIDVEYGYMIEFEYDALSGMVFYEDINVGQNVAVVYIEDEKYIRITPSDGKAIGNVTINGKNIKDYEQISDETYDDVESGSIFFRVSADKNLKIAAMFIDKINVTAADKVYTSNIDSAPFHKDSDYYFADSELNISGAVSGTAVRVTGTVGGEEKVYGGIGSGYVDISENIEIERIEVFYKAAGELVASWHDVSDFPAKQVMFDVTKPDLNVSAVNQSNDNSLYMEDVSIKISDIKDVDTSSGIKTIEYIIYGEDGKELPDTRKTLFSYKDEELVYKLDDMIVTENTNLPIRIEVKITDNVGNTSSKFLNLHIDKTKPEISVEYYDDKDVKVPISDNYFGERKAVITVKERNFDPAQADPEKIIKIAVAGLDGTALKDKNGEKIADYTYSFSEWKAGENNNGTDNDTYSVSVYFAYDGNYTLTANYTDLAGNASDTLTSEFVVDNTAPEGTVILQYSVQNGEGDTEFVDDDYKWENSKVGDADRPLDYKIYRNTDMTVRVDNLYDSTSDIRTEYYVYYRSEDETAVLTDEQLDKLTFTDKVPVISEEKEFVIYVRLTDVRAGNRKYLSTDGVLTDYSNTKITLSRSDDDIDIYNAAYGDVKVTLSADDIYKDLPYSGIRKVSYKVIVDDNEEPTDEKTWNVFEENGKQGTFSETITIDKAKNNSNNVRVVVTVVDNAGNEITNDISLCIDITVPLLQLKHQTENRTNTVDGMEYYVPNDDVTVTVTERDINFNRENLKYTVVYESDNPDQTGEYYTLTWDDDTANENKDSDEHTAHIKFLRDGIYTLTVDYTDNAGNAAEQQKTIFTVDDTAPMGSVTIESDFWSDLLSVLTFGLYSNTDKTAVFTSDDITAGVDKVEYYKENTPSLPSRGRTLAESLDILYEEGRFTQADSVTVNTDEVFTVYVRITDKAGNYTYISSAGYIVDKTEPEITLSADSSAVSSNGIYNMFNGENMTVNVSAVDPNTGHTGTAAYSGLKEITWRILNNGNVTQQGTELFQPGTSNTEFAELITGRDFKISVDTSLNNSSNVIVEVTASDNAGNVFTNELPLDIDITRPTISVSYDNDNAVNGKYFDAARTATVVITERNGHFRASDATSGIKITAVDASGRTINNAYSISGWETVNNSDPDYFTHTATISFRRDANYTFAVSYSDMAGNSNSDVGTGSSVAPYEFTVDTTAPTGTVSAASAEGREESWSSLVRSLSFGFWSNRSIRITGTTNDATSPVASVNYYKVSAKNAADGATALTKEQLDGVSSWSRFSQLNITDDEQFTVYIKITDMAGNYTYISTNGLIVDENAPVTESVAPIITIRQPNPKNGIYDGDVEMEVTVVDPTVGGTYSGINSIVYRVYDLAQNSSAPTATGTLYTFNYLNNPTQSQLSPKETDRFTVSRSNNSNNVVVEIEARDNAGNVSVEETSLKIDTTAPTINISYNNNSPRGGIYFNADRVASIAVTERNFNSDDVKLTVKRDGTAITPTLSGWRKTQGTGNEDNTVWTADLTYSQDGDYTFEIEYTDLAGNKAGDPVYAAGTAAPDSFTVDKTDPIVTVSYDNNSSENSNYFKNERTATITVVEHNFAASDIVPAITASDNGRSTPSAIPVLSSWTSNGDIHTATLHYSDDALYTFGITVTDMAGNVSERFANQSFYIDKTQPSIEILEVKDKSANGGKDVVVAPVVRVNDTNFDLSRVSITLTGAKNKSIIKYSGTADKTDAEKHGTFTDIENGLQYAVNNLTDDDIYTLSVTLTDMAGNVSSKQIEFSVNRLGSTFGFDQNTMDVRETAAGNANLQKLDNDIVIYEVNPDELENIEISIRKNGKTIVLEKDTDYKIDAETPGNGIEWYRYTYTIFKSVFADDATYDIIITSTDKAKNKKKSDDGITENGDKSSLSFTVDKTPPEIILTSELESGQTYALDGMTVTFRAQDGTSLDKVTVELDGEVLKTWDSGFDEELSFYISGESDAPHEVKLYCIDKAGNFSEILEVSDFWVTTNLLVRYYNNKPLFFGSIIGVVVLAGLVVFFIVWRRRKKDNAEQERQ